MTRRYQQRVAALSDKQAEEIEQAMMGQDNAQKEAKLRSKANN